MLLLLAATLLLANLPARGVDAANASCRPYPPTFPLPGTDGFSFSCPGGGFCPACGGWGGSTGGSAGAHHDESCECPAPAPTRPRRVNWYVQASFLATDMGGQPTPRSIVDARAPNATDLVWLAGALAPDTASTVTLVGGVYACETACPCRRAGVSGECPWTGSGAWGVSRGLRS